MRRLAIMISPKCKILIKGGDVGHFEIVGDVLGVRTKRAIIERTDHFLFAEHVLNAVFSVPIEGLRITIGNCIEWIFIDCFTFAFFLTKEPIDALLMAIRVGVPAPHTDVVEVGKFRFGVE